MHKVVDIERLLREEGITYTTQSKNVGEGWIGVTCPFCDDDTDHGGFNLDGGYYNCWRCGYHKTTDVLMELLGLGFRTVDDLIEAYTARRVMGLKKRGRQVKVPVETKLPAGCGPLQQPHRSYLRHRGFDDQRLEVDWGLQGTGPIGQYKFRIIAPIHLDGRLISYQGRDITGRQDLPYKACTREKEALHHKHSLYGIDKVPGDRALVVEGLFDVWRMGPGAIAPFGIEYTEEQVLMMADRLRHVHILFDPEEQAQRQADKMAIDLMQYGVEVELLNLTEREDPAEMTPAEALSLMGSLGIQM